MIVFLIGREGKGGEERGREIEEGVRMSYEKGERVWESY